LNCFGNFWTLGLNVLWFVIIIWIILLTNRILFHLTYLIICLANLMNTYRRFQTFNLFFVCNKTHAKHNKYNITSWRCALRYSHGLDALFKNDGHRLRIADDHQNNNVIRSKNRLNWLNGGTRRISNRFLLWADYSAYTYLCV